jgi:hypothetical protein
MAEIRLARAKNLLAKGQPHAALALLESGEPDERQRADYDALRASIQRGLLEAGRAVTPAAAR